MGNKVLKQLANQKKMNQQNKKQEENHSEQDMQKT